MYKLKCIHFEVLRKLLIPRKSGFITLPNSLIQEIFKLGQYILKRFHLLYFHSDYSSLFQFSIYNKNKTEKEKTAVTVYISYQQFQKLLLTFYTLFLLIF